MIRRLAMLVALLSIAFPSNARADGPWEVADCESASVPVADVPGGQLVTQSRQTRRAHYGAYTNRRLFFVPDEGGWEARRHLEHFAGRQSQGVRLTWEDGRLRVAYEADLGVASKARYRITYRWDADSNTLSEVDRSVQKEHLNDTSREHGVLANMGQLLDDGKFWAAWQTYRSEFDDEPEVTTYSRTIPLHHLVVGPVVDKLDEVAASQPARARALATWVQRYWLPDGFGSRTSATRRIESAYNRAMSDDDPHPTEGDRKRAIEAVVRLDELADWSQSKADTYGATLERLRRWHEREDLAAFLGEYLDGLDRFGTSEPGHTTALRKQAEQLGHRLAARMHARNMSCRAARFWVESSVAGADDPPRPMTEPWGMIRVAGKRMTASPDALDEVRRFISYRSACQSRPNRRWKEPTSTLLERYLNHRPDDAQMQIRAAQASGGRHVSELRRNIRRLRLAHSLLEASGEEDAFPGSLRDRVEPDYFLELADRTWQCQDDSPRCSRIENRIDRRLRALALYRYFREDARRWDLPVPKRVERRLSGDFLRDLAEEAWQQRYYQDAKYAWRQWLALDDHSIDALSAAERKHLRADLACERRGLRQVEPIDQE